MTKEHTPVPWRLDECCYGDNIIEGPNDEIIMWDTPAHKITPTVNDMAHIVKCVNMHDELVEALNMAVKDLQDWVKELKGNTGYCTEETEEVTAYAKSTLAKARGEV